VSNAKEKRDYVLSKRAELAEVLRVVGLKREAEGLSRDSNHAREMISILLDVFRSDRVVAAKWDALRSVMDSLHDVPEQKAAYDAMSKLAMQYHHARSIASELVLAVGYAAGDALDPPKG
jgi:hypothetical protein